MTKKEIEKRRKTAKRLRKLGETYEVIGALWGKPKQYAWYLVHTEIIMERKRKLASSVLVDKLGLT